jgi:hypothetical protein
MAESVYPRDHARTNSDIVDLHLRYLRRAPSALAVATNQARALHKPDAPPARRVSGASLQEKPLAAFSMHRDDHLTFAPLFMLVSVKAAAALGQPFPKCGAFHYFAPVYHVILSAQYHVDRQAPSVGHQSCEPLFLLHRLFAAFNAAARGRPPFKTLRPQYSPAR